MKLRLHCPAEDVAYWQARFPALEAVADPVAGDDAVPALKVDVDGLALVRAGGSAWRPEPVAARSVRRDSLLARACGIVKHPGASVLDAMAGWGSDGLELAALGARVDLVEASPLVQALLVERAAGSGITPASIRNDDGWSVLSSGEWDVVLLDPMFPERGRKGLAKLPMQLLQTLAVDDQRPLAEWIERAVEHSRHRVVVKRRRTEAVIGKPDWQVSGTTIRFDVYRSGKQQAGSPA